MEKVQAVKKNGYDDVLTILATTEQPREDFWPAWKLCKNLCKTYGLYTPEVRKELSRIKDLVLINNDVGTATFRLVSLVDELSKVIRRRSQ